MNENNRTYIVGDSEIKSFSITVEPAYVGEGKNKRLEIMVIIKKYDPAKEGYNMFQAIVPAKSRLDQEVNKLLKLSEQTNATK